MLLAAEFLAYAAIVLAAFGAALYRGGWRERSAAAAMALSWIASLLLTRRGAGWGEPQWGVFFVDASLLPLFFILAVKTPLAWARMMLGLQIADVLAHVAFIVEPGLWSPAYVALIQICSWGVMLCVLWGAVFARSVDDPSRRS
jgi:hypothetical protein